MQQRCCVVRETLGMEKDDDERSEEERAAPLAQAAAIMRATIVQFGNDVGKRRHCHTLAVLNEEAPCRLAH